MDLNGKTFGQRVKERRIERGMTQWDVVIVISSIGVEFSQPFLSQIESDKIDPNKIGVEKAHALCLAIKMPFSKLFWGLTDP